MPQEMQKRASSAQLLSAVRVWRSRVLGDGRRAFQVVARRIALSRHPFDDATVGRERLAHILNEGDQSSFLHPPVAVDLLHAQLAIRANHDGSHRLNGGILERRLDGPILRLVVGEGPDLSLYDDRTSLIVIYGHSCRLGSRSVVPGTAVGVENSHRILLVSMLVADMHLDLAMNALTLDRDLTRSVQHMRLLEAGMPEKGRAASTVAFPDMRRGSVGLCSATLFSRVGHVGSAAGGVRTQEIAYAAASGQMALYRLWERRGIVTIIETRHELGASIEAWEAWEARPESAQPPIGLVVAIEGADPIIEPEAVSDWFATGVRIASLAHYGFSEYAHGTGQPGGLRGRGAALLRAMAASGVILDLSHAADETFERSLDIFEGPVLASHSNCRALVPGDRQLTDDMIRAIAARGGVIGVAMDAWMLQPGWVRGRTTNESVSLETYADHIDHICQVTASGAHAGIGTDLDGGYGTEQCPRDLDTIADLQIVVEILIRRGYTAQDVRRIAWRNWVDLLGRALPAGAR